MISGMKKDMAVSGQFKGDGRISTVFVRRKSHSFRQYVICSQIKSLTL